MSLKVIDPNQFISNPGDRYKPEYIGEEDENGFIQLVEVGKTDLWELHQRDAFANDVNVLYERFCNGDISCLSQTQGTFMDALGLPRDLRGMYELIQGFDRQYENLPESIRQKYSREEFVSQAGSAQWMKDMQSMTDTQASSPAADTPSEAVT